MKEELKKALKIPRQSLENEATHNNSENREFDERFDQKESGGNLGSQTWVVHHVQGAVPMELPYSKEQKRTDDLQITRTTETGPEPESVEFGDSEKQREVSISKLNPNLGSLDHPILLILPNCLPK